jgi:hypothetical protein
MKYRFEPQELAWLHRWTNNLLRVTKRHGEDADARTLAKMKYKFTGTPSYTALGAKERRMLQEMVLYVLENHMSDMPGEEQDMLKGLAEKLVAKGAA